MSLHSTRPENWPKREFLFSAAETAMSAGHGGGEMHGGGGRHGGGSSHPSATTRSKLPNDAVSASPCASHSSLAAAKASFTRSLVTTRPADTSPDFWAPAAPTTNIAAARLSIESAVSMACWAREASSCTGSRGSLTVEDGLSGGDSALVVTNSTCSRPSGECLPSPSLSKSEKLPPSSLLSSSDDSGAPSLPVSARRLHRASGASASKVFSLD